MIWIFSVAIRINKELFWLKFFSKHIYILPCSRKNLKQVSSLINIINDFNKQFWNRCEKKIFIPAKSSSRESNHEEISDDFKLSVILKHNQPVLSKIKTEALLQKYNSLKGHENRLQHMIWNLDIKNIIGTTGKIWIRPIDCIGVHFLSLITTLYLYPCALVWGWEGKRE